MIPPLPKSKLQQVKELLWLLIFAAVAANIFLAMIGPFIWLIVGALILIVVAMKVLPRIF